MMNLGRATLTFGEVLTQGILKQLPARREGWGRGGAGLCKEGHFPGGSGDRQETGDRPGPGRSHREAIYLAKVVTTNTVQGTHWICRPQKLQCDSARNMLAVQ